jgi:selenophosphate synthetase-related protein
VHKRRILTSDQEWAIRHTTHLAFEKLVEMSGKSLGAVDIFFFEARKRCPEMIIPKCEKCSVELVCAQKKNYFNPFTELLSIKPLVDDEHVIKNHWMKENIYTYTV